MENQFISIVESILNRLSPQIDDGNKRVKLFNSDVFLSTSIGNERNRNEDRVVFALIKNQAISGTSLAIGALADGMGGMKEGDKAASITIAGFLTYLAAGESSEGLKDLCGRAIQYAHKLAIDMLGKKSGSTLSAIVYGKNGCVGINAGDSRIYSYDKFKGVNQITVDDTIAAQVIDINNDDDDDDWSDLNGGDNRLIQHIGMEGDLEPHIKDLSIKNRLNNKTSGYLLTSDGLHFIGKKMLTRIVKNSSSGSVLSERLTSIAGWLGGHDNLSLAVLPESIELTEDGSKGKATTISIFTPDAEFIMILPLKSHSKESKRTIIVKQKMLFDEEPIVIKAIGKEAPEKIDIDTKKCTNKKKKTPAKKKPREAKNKIASKKKVNNKTEHSSKEENVKAIIDFINIDDESGEKNEI